MRVHAVKNIHMLPRGSLILTLISEGPLRRAGSFLADAVIAGDLDDEYEWIRASGEQLTSAAVGSEESRPPRADAAQLIYDRGTKGVMIV